ncbi:unknown [Candidatus Apopatosoma intestinale]|nr:unknown [Candidatus Apopatosoma intestinale]
MFSVERDGKRISYLCIGKIRLIAVENIRESGRSINRFELERICIGNGFCYAGEVEKLFCRIFCHNALLRTLEVNHRKVGRQIKVNIYTVRCDEFIGSLCICNDIELVIFGALKHQNFRGIA